MDRRENRGAEKRGGNIRRGALLSAVLCGIVAGGLSAACGATAGLAAAESWDADGAAAAPRGSSARVVAPGGDDALRAVLRPVRGVLGGAGAALGQLSGGLNCDAPAAD